MIINLETLSNTLEIFITLEKKLKNIFVLFMTNLLYFESKTLW